MGSIKILGKTVEAMQLLRRPQSPLPKDARTLLVLIDGKRHSKHLQALAVANGVQSFEESLAHLKQAGLIQELPETEDDMLELEANATDYSAANRITLDFALPPGALDERPRVTAPHVRAPTALAQPIPPATQVSAAKRTADSALAAERNPQARQEKELYAKLMEELKPKVEAELRVKLLPEIRAAIQKELTTKLTDVLRPHVERQLRASLEAELKPRIEQEFRKRLEAALAERLQPASTRQPEEPTLPDPARSVLAEADQSAPLTVESDPAKAAS